MITISERDFHHLADAVRRRQRATGAPETCDALEDHAFRAMGFFDDLAEGESVNGAEYQVGRAALILHDVAATKVRSEASGEASAVLAQEMLASMGADESFADAVAQAIRFSNETGTASAPEDATCAQMLTHDACALALFESSAKLDRQNTSEPSQLFLQSARRISDAIAGGTPAQAKSSATVTG